MASKKWSIATLTTSAAICLVLLIVLGILTVVIDPFFHYHAPREGLAYPLDNQRYQNDGIIRHFEYDAIITGTSLADNFMASEFDSLFGVQSIKVTFDGTLFNEIDGYLRRALQLNPDVHLILRSMEGSSLLQDKDAARYDTSTYPTYLYDDNPFNDINYILNKTVLLRGTLSVILNTLAGNSTTTFDEYGNWNDKCVFGKEAVLADFTRPDRSDRTVVFTAENEQMLRDNLQQNVIALAEENPDVTFYIFFPPYSVLVWDTCAQEGRLSQWIDTYKRATELLLPCENIKLFGFDDQFEITTDLANYMDTTHYGQEINAQMLQWMSAGEHQLTEDNYLDYFKRIEEFYATYDFDSIYA